MEWHTIILAIIGSGVISTLVVEISNRRKNNREAERIGAEADKLDTESEGLLAEHYDGYADRLESRIIKLEGRLDRLERRDMIFESAISCAYKCEIANEMCPVLVYLSHAKIPKKVEDR